MTLGRLIAGAAPLSIIKVGLIAMAVVDAVLVFGGTLDEPAATLNAADPRRGAPAAADRPAGPARASATATSSPRRCSAGSWRPSARRSVGWALVLFARQPWLWNQLFLVTDLLPATVPVALVLIACEGLNRPECPAVSLPLAVLLLSLVFAGSAFGPARAAARRASAVAVAAAVVASRAAAAAPGGGGGGDPTSARGSS